MSCVSDFEARLEDVADGDGAWSDEDTVEGDYLASTRVKVIL